MAYIYKITNLINNKSYIGQTIKSLEHRFRKHKGQKNCKNRCSALYNAFIKYGTENFIIESLVSGSFSKEELNHLEIEYIQKYNSLSPNGYNLQTGGGSFLVTEDVKKKTSNKLKGRKVTWGDKVGESVRKLWQDPEYRKRMSDAHRHKIGKYKKHSKPLRKPLDTKLIKEYYQSGKSINWIAKKLGVSFYTIQRRIR